MVAGDQTFSLRVTDSARAAYLELLDYFLKHYSVNRANELAQELLDTPLQLLAHPYMGSLEPALADKSNEYRYLIFQRSHRATIKIIYYVDDSDKVVYVTDFFPTEMRPEKVKS